MFFPGDVVRLLHGALKNEVHIIQQVKPSWNGKLHYLLVWNWLYAHEFTPCDTPLFACLWLPDLTRWSTVLLYPEALSPLPFSSQNIYRSDLEAEIRQLYPDISFINYVELQTLLQRRNTQ